MPPNTGPVGIGVGIRPNHHNVFNHSSKRLLKKQLFPTSSVSAPHRVCMLGKPALTRSSVSTIYSSSLRTTRTGQ
jgi:hypothetical protein